jgi:surface antigen
MSIEFATIRLRIPAHISLGRLAAKLCRRAASVSSLIALLVFATTSAPAQVNPFGKAGGNLTNEDWAQLNAAKAKVLAEPAAVGTKGSWTNPKSGNSGSIDITKAFNHGDLPCRSVKYVFHLKTQKQQGTYLMNECKTADGSWKFL